jgi:T5SS/PEP-CTERM-associated repeat protein
LASVVAGAVCLTLASGSRADVVGEGDVAPGAFDTEFDIWVPFDGLDVIEGGTVTGTIIVGGTTIPETGTVVGRLVIDLPALTDPLFSTNGYIGGADEDDEEQGWDGIGEVVVTGLGSEWSVDERMIVGLNGTGYLTLSTGAKMESDRDDSGSATDPDFTMGENMGSQGFATVTGFGTRMINREFVIGRRGFARLEVTTRARIETHDEAIIGDEANLGPNELGTGEVILTGIGTRWNIGEVNPGADYDGPGSLTVGRQGRGDLSISGGAMVVVENDTRIGSLIAGGTQSYGRVTVGGGGNTSTLWNQDQLFVGSSTSSAAGELNLQFGGVSRADTNTNVGVRGLVEMVGGTLLTPTVTNAGVIRGSGRLEAAVINNGQIRNAASTADLRQYLRVTGAVTNNSDIESVGGEMEFDSLVTNVGAGADIVGVDAIFRFNGGLTGGGNMFLDNTVVWTPGTFTPAGVLSIEASTSKLVGSLDLASTSNLLVEIGDEFSRFEISSAAMLDGTLSVSLGSSYVPKAGDRFEILEANGGVTGDFSTFSPPSISGFSFDYTLTANSVIINVDAGFVFSADFNGDGVVDGADLAIWRANFGLMPATPAMGDANGDGKVDGADYLIWSTTLGPVPPITPAVGAVPEPGAAGMALVAAVLGWHARRRRAV